jgi:hypothetical protein
MNAQQKAMLESYGRSFLAAMTATFMATGGDLFALDADILRRQFLASGIAAVLPVALRYINKKDPAFGKIAEVIAAEGLKKLTAKKVVAKKAVVKKSAK